MNSQGNVLKPPICDVTPISLIRYRKKIPSKTRSKTTHHDAERTYPSYPMHHLTKRRKHEKIELFVLKPQSGVQCTRVESWSSKEDSRKLIERRRVCSNQKSLKCARNKIILSRGYLTRLKNVVCHTRQHNFTDVIFSFYSKKVIHITDYTTYQPTYSSTIPNNNTKKIGEIPVDSKQRKKDIHIIKPHKKEESSTEISFRSFVLFVPAK